MKTKLNIEESGIRIIIVSGILLTVIQFFFNRSLFVDEASLALNIIHRSSFELLKPLDSIQVAPILFLQIEKFFSLLIPDSEFGLRLFPLICFFITLYFIFKLLKAIFSSSESLIFALSLFVFNTMIIRYATEIKQYMGDVMLVSAVGYFTLMKFKNEKTRYIALAITGTIGIFLSNIAPIILLSSGLFLLYKFLLIEQKNFKPMFITSALWASVFFVYYLLFINDHANRDIQISSFSKRNGFFIINPFHPHFFNSINFIFNNIFKINLPFGTIGKIILSVLFASGLYKLIQQKNYGLIIFTITPLITHLVFSGLKMYPIMPRLMLYLIVVVIIVITKGFDMMLHYFNSITKTRITRYLILLLPLIMFIQVFVNGYPLKNAEIKNTIKYVEKRIKPDESVFVDSRAFKAFSYYRDIQYFKMNSPVIFGKKLAYNKKITLNYFDDIQGKTWLIFAGGNHGNNLKLMNKLKNEGYPFLDEFIKDNSSVHLVDFGYKNAEQQH